MRARVSILFFAIAAALFVHPSLAGSFEDAKTNRPVLMRYPDIRNGRIVFVAYGNLWTVAADGGAAHRLTDDPGHAMLPRYSPDGRWIAYTQSRPGAQDVYVIPSEGGTPQRLTFRSTLSNAGTTHGPDDNIVVTWTPDSQGIVFLSRRMAWNDSDFRAYVVPVDGGLPRALPLDHAGFMTFGSDKRVIAFNRLFRNFATQKRYDGGQAQNIFTYDFCSKRLNQITEWKGTDTFPMWYRHRIYFLSDRDANRRENIWVYDEATKKLREVTHFTNYDIDFPSLGADHIVFQQGGQLFTLDVRSETLRTVSVDVPEDTDRTSNRFEDVADEIQSSDISGDTDYAIAPQGTAALFSAHGDLFTVPTTGGKATDLTNTGGADEEHPSWSPDGTRIAYQTDVSGEQELAVRPVSGGSERILTEFPTGYLYAPLWSPDSRNLAVGDAQHRLWLVALNGGAPECVATDPYSEIHDAAFSPDSRWLAYSVVRPNQLRAIHIFNLRSRTDAIISAPFEDDRMPNFGSDGKSLYFVSRRNVFPILSESDSGPSVATVKPDGIFLIRIDPKDIARTSAGMLSRAVALPIDPADITATDLRGEELFYQTRPTQLIAGAMPGERSALHRFNLVQHSDLVIAEGLDNYRVSDDGATVVAATGHSFQILRLTSLSEASLDLASMHVSVEPRAEWREMFENAWRIERDMFVSAQTDGVDWHRVHDAYVRLLPLAGSSDDLTYLIGEMVGELASSHTFVGAVPDGDTRALEHTPLLGADYALDPSSGRYRIARIYGGDPSRATYRSPLGNPGLNVATGNYLLAINGHELRYPDTPDKLMLGASSIVHLSIAKSPADRRRDVVVTPIDDELALRRWSWVEENRAFVDHMSGGKIGYVFLSDFYSIGYADFVRQFYPQIGKSALVIDIRWNTGGFTSQLILDILNRHIAGIFVNRERAVTTLPGSVFTGPRITLVNHFTSSDGDQFAYYFQKERLGRLVGTRTWGGVHGILGRWNLMGGGYVFAPKDALASDGGWVIENAGVTPDVEVEELPDEGETRRDAQLETTVHMLLEQLASSPKVRASVPSSLPAYPPAGEVAPSAFPTSSASLKP